MRRPDTVVEELSMNYGKAALKVLAVFGGAIALLIVLRPG